MKKSSRSWAVAFIVSLVPLVYLILVAFGFTVSQGELLDYIALGLAAMCSLPIWGAAVIRARQKKNYQDLLSLVALLVSYGFALISHEYTYFWQSVAITSVLLLGGWIQHAQLTRLNESIKDFAAHLPTKVSLVEGLEIEHIDIDELEIGEVVLVRQGMRIPADGYVIQGQAQVSQREITGETEPVFKVPGDWVLAGSEVVNSKGELDGPLTIRIAAVGQELVAHQLEASMDLENISAARFTQLAKLSGNLLTIVTLSASLIAAGIALVVSQVFESEIMAAVSVLLAGQIALVANSARLGSEASSIAVANLGVIMGDRSDFEALATVNHVVLGKTGVLTRGYQRVGSIHLARNTSIGSEAELLALAAAVEMGTSHELGHLIIQEAAKRDLELPVVSEVAPIPGLGVSARFDGSLIQVGNAGLVNVSGINMNPYDLFRVSNAYQEGSSVVFVSIDELLVGYIEFPDETRANSQQAIVELSGKHAITILSGDATGVVERLTTSLGLTEFAAEVLSNRKGDWIRERRASGSKVLYVADGHYDAAALAEADVPYAFNAGHSVHLGSAKLIQVSGDPVVIPRIISLSRKVQARTRLNIIVGLTVSVLLVAAGFIGVAAPLVALTGMAVSWFMTGRLVRLAK